MIPRIHSIDAVCPLQQNAIWHQGSCNPSDMGFYESWSLTPWKAKQVAQRLMILHATPFTDADVGEKLLVIASMLAPKPDTVLPGDTLSQVCDAQ